LSKIHSTDCFFGDFAHWKTTLSRYQMLLQRWITVLTFKTNNVQTTSKQCCSTIQFYLLHTINRMVFSKLLPKEVIKRA